MGFWCRPHFSVHLQPKGVPVRSTAWMPCACVEAARVGSFARPLRDKELRCYLRALYDPLRTKTRPIVAPWHQMLESLPSDLCREPYPYVEFSLWAVACVAVPNYKGEKNPIQKFSPAHPPPIHTAMRNSAVVFCARFALVLFQRVMASISCPLIGRCCLSARCVSPDHGTFQSFNPHPTACFTYCSTGMETLGPQAVLPAADPGCCPRCLLYGEGRREGEKGEREGDKAR